MGLAKSKAPRLGRPPGRFTQHRRLSRLREALEAHPSGLALVDIAQALRITTRSVRRYLRYLERETELESIGTAPGGAHLWRIKPSERGRAVMLRRTQAYGLLAARRAFDPMKGSGLYEELDLITSQLLQIAQRPTKGEIASDTGLEGRFLYVPEAARNYARRGEDLDEIFRAVADLRVMTFRYAPSTEAPNEKVTAHPYAMLLYRGAIHAIGLDAGCGDVRAFVLDRMSDAHVSETEHFTLPDGFDIADYIQGDFGVGRAPEKGRLVHAVVEFDPRVADEVRSKKVHPTQKAAASPDGRVRLSLSVPDLAPLVGWVLGYGGAARVIEPPELRQAVLRELHAAIQRYPPL